MCDEVIELYNEETKTIPTNFNKKNITFKTQNFYILLSFLLITIALLIAVNTIQNNSVLGSVKYMDLLKFMIELEI